MRVSVTSRTAVYGPVRTVVWEGRSREAPPYPDLWQIMLQESPNAVRSISHKWTKRSVIANRCGLQATTELACKFMTG